MNAGRLAFVIAAGSVAFAQTAGEKQSVEVQFTIEPADATRTSAQPLRAGDIARVRFRVRDKVSKTPLEGRYPSAWMVLHGDDNATCRQRVQRLLNPGIFSRPEIDLNTYYVLVMNADATIGVVDPLFGYGNTKLLALIPLPAPAQDWALWPGVKPMLFASLRGLGKLAVIDATTWRVVKTIDVAPGAGRTAIDPDSRAVWVAHDSGVAAISTSGLDVVGQVRTGKGPHEIAFSTDAPLVYVTNRAEGTVSIVDRDRMAIVRTVQARGEPAGIAYSAKGRAVYVTDSANGRIVAVHGAGGEPPTVIDSEPGIGPIRFVRDGRFGFALNPARKHVFVLDSSTNRIVQTLETEFEPDQVTFSGTLAYIRQRGSESVLMISLDAIGEEGKRVPAADFPAGQHPLGQVSMTTPADSIVRAPAENAVLVANPADKAIYYYQEGMAAPMGFFSNYSREPRAVQVVDRTLRQTSPGAYETTVTLDRAGRYAVAFLLDSPQAVECWDVTVEPDPRLPQSARAHTEVEYLIAQDVVAAGVPIAVRFRLRDAVAKTARGGAGDVVVQAYRAPGVWQQRRVASPQEGGAYEASFTLPAAGIYHIHVQSASLGVTLESNTFVVRAAEQ
jgi:hypothetical protein